MGNQSEAESFYRRAVDRLNRVVDANTRDPFARRSAASVANSVGVFYSSGRSQPDYDKAVEYYQRSIGHYRDDEARGLQNLGDVRSAQRDYDRSLELRLHWSPSGGDWSMNILVCLS